MRSIFFLLVSLAACSVRAPTPSSAPGGGSASSSVPASAPAPLPAAQVKSAPIPGTSLVVWIRPLVTNLAPGDPVGVALHWEDSTPRKPDTFFPFHMSAPKTLDALNFLITAPDGSQRSVAARWKPLEGVRDDGTYLDPSLLITLRASGGEEGHGYDGVWRTAPPDFSQAGVYRVQVEGKLVTHEPKTFSFQSPEVSIAIGVSGLEPLAKLKEAALAERGRRAPEAIWVPRGQDTSSGFLADTVLEDERGNRILRMVENWVGFGYSLHTATFSPEGALLSYQKDVVGTCVGEGTEVETEVGARPIEEIAVGERVWGYDLSLRERVLTTVTAVHRYTVPEALRFGGLLVTPEHPVYVDGEWKSAGLLRGGEKLFSAALLETVAPAPLIEGGPLEVFDLSAEEPHNFFAGGFLVHNKGVLYKTALFDPWFFMWNPKAGGAQRISGDGAP